MGYGNSAQNAVLEVAAFSLERVIGGARGTAAGLVVQPVSWIVTGNAPDAADTFIYGTSVAGAFIGAIVSVPAIITGAVKAAVDDHTQTLVAEAKLDEPQQVRDGIYSVDDYSFAASGGHIQSMTIASFGGVAWRHPNGVYLFIRDATGRVIADYQPRRWTRVYAPDLPLQMGDTGRVRWSYRSR